MGITSLDSDVTIYVLGAGASKAAGIPLMSDFIPELEQDLQDPKSNTHRYLESRKRSKPEEVVIGLRDLQSMLAKHPQSLNINGSPVPDVELMLSALDSLKNADQDPMSYLTTGFKTEAEKVRPLSDDIADVLRYYVRYRCVCRSAEDTAYLDPLVITSKGVPLEIYSLNYDPCIEIACERNNLSYTDGFSNHWDPELFGNDSYRVKLYKLHGSVTWYRMVNDSKQLVRIPYVVLEPDITYLSAFAVEDMISYPAMRKDNGSEPYRQLMARFEVALSKADNVVVIGYSLRDPEIRTLIADSLRKDQAKVCVLAGPDAETLTQHPDFDSIRLQMLPLMATAEESLRRGLIHQVVGALKSWRQYYRQAIESDARAGTRWGSPHWERALKAAAEAFRTDYALDLAAHLPGLRKGTLLEVLSSWQNEGLTRQVVKGLQLLADGHLPDASLLCFVPALLCESLAGGADQSTRRLLATGAKNADSVVDSVFNEKWLSVISRAYSVADGATKGKLQRVFQTYKGCVEQGSENPDRLVYFRQACLEAEK